MATVHPFDQLSVCIKLFQKSWWSLSWLRNRTFLWRVSSELHTPTSFSTGRKTSMVGAWMILRTFYNAVWSVEIIQLLIGWENNGEWWLRKDLEACDGSSLPCSQEHWRNERNSVRLIRCISHLTNIRQKHYNYVAPTWLDGCTYISYMFCYKVNHKLTTLYV
jgi:hypothetical protein